MVFYLLYVSSAVKKFSDEQLKSLLFESRNNNDKNNITGMLLYCEGNFIQALEGDEAQVLELFGKIKMDSRHHHIIKVLSGWWESRKFSDWSMGFCAIDSNQFLSLTGYREYRKDILFKEFADTDKHPAVILLRSFCEGQPMREKLDSL